MNSVIPPGLGVAPAAGQPGADRMRQVCREFESVFVEMLLGHMREASQGVGGEQRSFARDVFEGWQTQQWAGAVAAGGGIGLAEKIYQQLSQKGTDLHVGHSGDHGYHSAPGANVVGRPHR